MRTTTVLSFIAVALAAGCGATPPPATPAPAPAPQPGAPDLTMQLHVQDSIARENQARTDSVAQARGTAEAEARKVASAAAATNIELRRELGVMIHFDVARSAIRVDDSAALDRKVAILAANPGVRLQITGATDDRGSDAYNQALGSRRASAVKQYLVNRGIDAGRLTELSIGEKTPLETGPGEAAWARNRRAEFVIVSTDRPLAMNE